MVAFEILLLGIIFGSGPVRLMAAPPVAAIEIRLDGVPFVTLHSPPWATTCDFGLDPVPHELTAIGLDAKGREVARATQWINLGHARVKVSAILERDAKTARPTAVRVAWDSLELAQGTLSTLQPQVVTATLDGVPLPFADPHRIPLPAVDLAQPHLVSVEAAFSDELRDRADIAFGGDVIDRAETDLTAVAVTLGPKQASLDARAAHGVFSVGQTPLDVVAVDIGRAEVALVVDQAVSAITTSNRKEWARRSGEDMPLKGPLGAIDDRFFVATSLPILQQEPGHDRSYYEMSSPMRLSWLSRYPVLSWLTIPSDPTHRQKIADVVAAAAAEIAASNHRRALVLVLAEAPPGPDGRPTANDVSTFRVGAVKAYLAALDVPLVVWSLTGPEPGPLTAAWGPAVAVPNRWIMRANARKLEKMLEAQRIVWLAGRHLPQRIALDESTTQLRFAR